MFYFPYSSGCNFTPMLAQLSLVWAKVLQPKWNFCECGCKMLPVENLTKKTQKNVLSYQCGLFGFFFLPSILMPVTLFEQSLLKFVGVYLYHCQMSNQDSVLNQLFRMRRNHIFSRWVKVHNSNSVETFLQKIESTKSLGTKCFLSLAEWSSGC